MSLFRRVTRHRVSPTQDPRENRLTEVTAAVLERVEGLGLDVIDAVLASAAISANERLFDAADEPETTRLVTVRDALEAQLRRLRDLDQPRLLVDTQVTTASSKFVDLQMRVMPRPFTAGESSIFWVEVKHGADVHGTQLTDYETDIALADADHRLVLIVAPRNDARELTGVPDNMPVVEWQAVAEVVRRWAKRPELGEVERFLLTDYLEYLKEEGLMDEELLTAEHAFALRAAPAATSTVAKLMEATDAYVTHHWGPRGKKKGGQSPAYGPDYWAHYELAPKGGAPAPETWRSTTFEWGMFGDTDRAEPRNAWVFVAGATFWAARDDPAKVADNAQWLAARRKDDFEHVSMWSWRLFRFRYPEELLAATTLEGQVELLGEWVVESFRKLASAPPPQ